LAPDLQHGMPRERVFPRRHATCNKLRRMPSSTSDAPPATRRLDPAYGARLRRHRNLAAASTGLLLAVAVLTGVLDAATTVHEDRTFTVGAGPHLVVRDGGGGGLRGGIAVHAGAPDVVHVEGKVHATWRVRYVLARRADEILIEARPRPFLGWLSLLGPARFTVTAPPDTRLDVESRSAPIEVQGLAGGGSLETTHGDVRVRLDGSPSLRLEARTIDGAITASRVLTVSERTPNALVATMGGGAAELRIRTTSGAITIE